MVQCPSGCPDLSGRLRALSEAPTELAVQSLGIVTRHIQPAAFFRAAWSECRDDDVTVDFECASYGRRLGQLEWAKVGKVDRPRRGASSGWRAVQTASGT